MKTIITFFCLCFSVIAFSQTTVTGNVVDQSQNPILGANIVVVDAALGTSSDYDGNFTLTVTKIPLLQFKLVVSVIKLLPKR